MGHIIPRSLLTQVQMTSKLKTLADDLKKMAADETNSDEVDWVVRDALPLTDFGFNTQKWLNQTVQVANTWVNDWSQELEDDKYVAFYGIALHALNPTIYGTRFKLGAGGVTTIDTLHFQKLKLEEIPVGFFEKIIYTKEKTIYIDLIADAATAQYGEEFELLCLVCEKFGEVVSGAKRTF